MEQWYFFNLGLPCIKFMGDVVGDDGKVDFQDSYEIMVYLFNS